MTYTATSEIETVVRRFYVQHQDARQKEMGLSYTTAETRDLSKFIAGIANQAYRAGVISKTPVPSAPNCKTCANVVACMEAERIAYCENGSAYRESETTHLWEHK